MKKELDFVYITVDGKRFSIKEEAEAHEQELKTDKKTYELFNRRNKWTRQKRNLKKNVMNVK